MLQAYNTSISLSLRQLESSHGPCLHERKSHITDESVFFMATKQKQAEPLC